MTGSASAGDNPPIATSGDPTLAILSRDTLQSSYQDIGLIDQFDPTAGQLSGVTPFSYASGALPVVRDKATAASIMMGNFGPEVALITDASERSDNLTLAGTDNIVGQAVLYASASEILIGEELYAGGAYLQAGPLHTASLRAQDIMRWVLIALILIGILLKSLGIDLILIDMLERVL
jgi:hypothetical protein